MLVENSLFKTSSSSNLDTNEFKPSPTAFASTTVSIAESITESTAVFTAVPIVTAPITILTINAITPIIIPIIAGTFCLFGCPSAGFFAHPTIPNIIPTIIVKYAITPIIGIHPIIKDNIPNTNDAIPIFLPPYFFNLYIIYMIIL